jgi:ligand-binding SRPBCC domain-containing protein
MPVFTRSTRVPADPEALFLFHGNPHNIRAVSPPGLRILAIEASEQAREGETFTVSVRQGPLPLRWTGRWLTVQAPRLLIDGGEDCPFAHWRHHHIFEAAEGRSTILTDRVEFRLPWHLGGPVGDLVLLHLVLPRVFAARHAATRAWFTAHPS